ncbi:3D-(3,5/4)-trihydroxycyclohexane-1,2-dione acylhydrolase (decyclizing) [Sporichthya brevicatena]|uniref:3D-(3,5/4)-trihydroxycyclohexane-1,2-dione acylhydrolase (Decyclizing) n=1 Tax=Sporichthya brevicatena TaxID=171442 RepID=A0ABP3SKF9_9ACTN
MRLTVAQALVRFLAVQYSERDGTRQRLIPGCFGIFGHGNVAGVGQALLENATEAPKVGDPVLPYYLARNEQAMVHAACGYARMRDRLQTLACTTSIGPGATNMVTGAALATINRLPVLLLPGDVFATRAAGAVLQELELPGEPGTTVNDAFRPVSRFFARIERPEQLPPALLGAMRTLTDPAETGAVTLALPQDVQAEAYDWPDELFAERTWLVARPAPDTTALARAAELLRGARRPLVVAGGGVTYSAAESALRSFAEATGIPVADTHAGKGTLPFDHALSAGPLGATGTPVANSLAAEADVVLGVGTRWSDFTTGSRTVFGPATRFVNLNVAAFDSAKHGALMLTADARAGLEALTTALAGHRAPAEWTARLDRARATWTPVADAALTGAGGAAPVQTAVLGAVNEALNARAGTMVAAAGSMPGQLQMLWRARTPKGYHVEYGYSCMGYEIAGALGVKMAAPERDVVALVGDGSYLMMSQEIVTAVSERIPLTVVLVDNAGFGSIGALSESLGSQRFGTSYRYRNPASGRLDGDVLPVDLATNAASLGAEVFRPKTLDEFRADLDKALASPAVSVVHVQVDPLAPAPSSGCWWDVPVAEVSALESTQAARSAYEGAKKAQRPLL